MPRKQLTRTPSYRLHKPSGQAVVTIGGRDIYLGPHGSPKSRTRYDELIAQWLANGRVLPASEPQPLTVSELIVQFYEACREKYGHRRTAVSNLSRTRSALRHLRKLFGTTLASAFGPKALKAVRTSFINAGLSRKTLNERVQIVKRCFEWGVAEELVPPSVIHGLSAVRGLRAGESKAAEPKRVTPVPEEHVHATLPYILPPVAAMVQVQILTGMRPGEATRMTTAQIDMSGELWIYRPPQHKSDRLGIVREICIGAKAQAVIKPFLRPKLDEFLFRPDEAEEHRDVERRRLRKTPLWPSHQRRLASKRKESPKRVPRDHYAVTSYARAVRRGSEKASVPRWTPNQLRHTFASNVRKQYGIEAARIMLGHQHMDTSEIYAERDLAVAEQIARKIG